MDRKVSVRPGYGFLQVKCTKLSDYPGPVDFSGVRLADVVSR